MKIEDAFENVEIVFLDTAPVIYYVEENPNYFAIVKSIFDDLIEKKTRLAVTSPVTLAECLVVPLRNGIVQRQQDFIDFLKDESKISLEIIDEETGEQAAIFRAKYNLKLPDALQVAVALQANCDAFLTNDVIFKRVTEIPIIILGELELSNSTLT